MTPCTPKNPIPNLRSLQIGADPRYENHSPSPTRQGNTYSSKLFPDSASIFVVESINYDTPKMGLTDRISYASMASKHVAPTAAIVVRSFYEDENAGSLAAKDDTCK